MTSPADIRHAARAARRALGPAERTAADRAICDALLDVLDERSPGALALYLSTDAEVDVCGAADSLRARGWQLLAPVIGDGASMRFARWDAMDELSANRYGIAEPPPDAETLDASQLDVVVVPCVAVDADGHRLGFGAGYYDRALATAQGVLRVGVAYETQVVERIAARPWDVPLHVVLTEGRVLRCGEPPR